MSWQLPTQIRERFLAADFSSHASVHRLLLMRMLKVINASWFLLQESITLKLIGSTQYLVHLNAKFFLI